MDMASVWNELSYFDGMMFTIWIAIIYIGKKVIDQKIEDKNG